MTGLKEGTRPYWKRVLFKAGIGLIEENSILYKAGTGLKQDPFPIRPGALFKAGYFVCHRAALNRDLYCNWCVARAW